MVEGPGVHRVAIAHRQILLGLRYAACSPNEKFREGAAVIDGQVLSRIEAHGKNIFYFFTKDKLQKSSKEDLSYDVVVVHIHFGMSGSFQTFSFPGPEPRPATRLKLTDEKQAVVAHLSASICKHGDIQLYKKAIERLGPDPLRDDADKEHFWASLQKSRKKIGSLLMDQSIIAGIGNIYRAELLFIVGVHPDQPASSLTRATFELIWVEAQRLLRVGVVTGSIITVSETEAGKSFSKLKKGEKRYVYNHRNCRRCNGVVKCWKSAQRTVYACEACQPLLMSGTSKDHQERVDSQNEEGVMTPACLSSSKHCDALAITSTLSKKKVISRSYSETVEHQAFKHITTGGLVDFGSPQRVLPDSIAPTTPEKPDHLKGPRKSGKRRHQTLQY